MYVDCLRGHFRRVITQARVFAFGLIFLVAACASPTNRILDRNDAAKLGSNGVVFFRFTRDPRLRVNRLALEISRLDVTTGKPVDIHGEKAENVALALLQQQPYLNRLSASNGDAEYFAFSLPPGGYGIARVRDIPISASSGLQHATVYGGGPFTALLVAGVAVAVDVGTIIKRENHKDKTGTFPGEINFGVSALDAPPPPQFTISPGCVTYIGDFSIGVQIRQAMVQVSEQQGPQAEDIVEGKRAIEDRRLELSYAFSPDTARGHATRLGLFTKPFEATRLDNLTEKRLVLRDFVHRTSSEDHVDVRTVKTTSPDRAVTNTSVPRGELNRQTNLKDLMRRFLAGEISQAEYIRQRNSLR